MLWMGIVTSSNVEVWGEGTPGMMEKIALSKALALKDSKALTSKSSCCGDMVPWMSGCSKYMSAKVRAGHYS